VDDEVPDVRGLEQQPRADRHLLAEDGDDVVDVVAGREPAALVELAVGRQVGLRDHAEHLAAADHDGRVEHPAAAHHRRPDDEDGPQVGGGHRDVLDRRLDRLQQGVLQEQVVDRVAREAQLREHRDRDALLMARAGLLEHGTGVGGRVGRSDRDRHGRNPGEPVGVGGVEVHVGSLGIRRCWFIEVCRSGSRADRRKTDGLGAFESALRPPNPSVFRPAPPTSSPDQPAVTIATGRIGHRAG
jgi:hypothetical protein